MIKFFFSFCKRTTEEDLPNPGSWTGFKMLQLLLLTLTLTVMTAAGDIKVDIDEEVEPGTEVAQLRDYLQDYPTLPNDQIPFTTYAILNPNSSSASYFRVDSRTGVVTVAKRMDRETICDPRHVCSVRYYISYCYNKRCYQYVKCVYIAATGCRRE